MREGPRDECGVFGLYAPGHEVSRLSYFALPAVLQRVQGEVRQTRHLVTGRIQSENSALVARSLTHYETTLAGAAMRAPAGPLGVRSLVLVNTIAIAVSVSREQLLEARVRQRQLLQRDRQRQLVVATNRQRVAADAAEAAHGRALA